MVSQSSQCLRQSRPWCLFKPTSWIVESFTLSRMPRGHALLGGRTRPGSRSHRGTGVEYTATAKTEQALPKEAARNSRSSTQPRVGPVLGLVQWFVVPGVSIHSTEYVIGQRLAWVERTVVVDRGGCRLQEWHCAEAAGQLAGKPTRR